MAALVQLTDDDQKIAELAARYVIEWAIPSEFVRQFLLMQREILRLRYRVQNLER